MQADSLPSHACASCQCAPVSACLTHTSRCETAGWPHTALVCPCVPLCAACVSADGAVTDNWPTIEPYFNETGSNSPSILPSYQQRELLELAVKSCKALGLQIVSG